MDRLDIARLRLHNQQIAEPQFRSPAEVVAHLGAVQAQDYAAGKWAIGLRLSGATDADIEQAIAERTIVRTWPMRRTLHFVPATDVRWMLALTASRADAGFAYRYRQLGLDERTLAAAGEALGRALSGGKSLSRPSLYRVLKEAGIETSGGPVRPGALPESAQARGLHILGHHAQQGLICYGVMEGKQPAFALLDEWAPQAKQLGRDEALAELAKRYFTSHGPATVQDFVWWSGLTVRDTKLGIELAGDAVVKEEMDGIAYWLAPAAMAARGNSRAAYLLPPWDEYTVAYRDRSAVIAPQFARQVSSGGGMLRPIVVIDSLVSGTWKATTKTGSLVVALSPFGRLTQAKRRAVQAATERYAGFLGLPSSGVTSPD